MRSSGGTKTLSVKVAGHGARSAARSPRRPRHDAHGPAPSVPAPAAPSTGNAAFEAIKGYLADSRFTDCPAGWPNCAVEERYSHFANGDHYYCRLTPTSGSDIRSYGSIAQISGAEHNADGSWGVEYYLSSYGNTTFYSWSVSNQGVVNGRYWGPDRTRPRGPGRDDRPAAVGARREGLLLLFSQLPPHITSPHTFAVQSCSRTAATRSVRVFYRRHLRAVLAYLVHRTGRRDLAADLAAETFAGALQSLPRYRPSAGSARG